MTNQTIDNGADEQFGNVILWQYDKAEKLCAFVNELKSFYNQTTKEIWDTMLSQVNIDNADDFGLSLIGALIGCKRPNDISTELFRKILKARFRLMMSNYSVYDINLYLETIFGSGIITVNDNGAVESDDNDYAPMTLSWNEDESEMTDEEKSLVENYPELIYVYPAGVRNRDVFNFLVFALDGQDASSPTDPAIGGLDESGFFWNFLEDEILN